MSSFEKVIKGACKPKAAPPKSKYLDSIIAATWSEDGAVHDVCKALSPRFREPNAVVVFKALIVLHTMIRNGATDNVLSYLSTADVLKLRNVSSGSWEGYSAPENLQNYAMYLDTRIRAYRDLKHDAIKVQSETNRDMRNSIAIEDDTLRNRGDTTSNNPERRKTIMGRKLRVMTVEKGLLRETKVVQKMINALVECRFYLDNLDDELNITTLRMLVKDLLILFQACNEGVINLLEHYFEMSHVDASQALSLYRNFCKLTERVVEFLGVGKKLQNLLNVPIPNLKHAPVSLAGALEEYLNDPNFEQNRIEYKTSKDAAERNALTGAKPKSEPVKDPSPSVAPTSAVAVPAKAGEKSNPVQDFFNTIEEEQPTMFNPQTNSPSTTYFQQQATSNPFFLGGALGSQPVQMQQTGFMLPQNTAFQLPQQQHSAHNPFGHLQNQQQPFLQPQPTSFIQPQATGLNPFRQTTLMPQMTGFLAFSGSQPPDGVMNAFLPHNGGLLEQQSQQPGNLPPFTLTPFGATTSTPIPFNGFPSPSAIQQSSPDVPPRPASAPLSSLVLTASSVNSPPEPAKTVKTHQTGSRNPFGVPTAPPPPVPKVPTLMELAMNMQASNSQQRSQQGGPNGSGVNGSLPSSGSTSSTQPSAMSSVASDFALLKLGDRAPSSFTGFGSNLSPSTTSTTTVSSPDTSSASLPGQSTGMAFNTSASLANTSSIPVNSPALNSHVTGVFTGLKAFKPTSSFGAQLLESLPPIPQSAPGTPTLPSENPLPAIGASTSSTSSSKPTGLTSGANNVGSGLGGLGSQQNGLGASSTGFGALNSQTTGVFGGNPFGSTGASGGNGGTNNGGYSTNLGLRPQMTGAAGAANPFRSSTFGDGAPTGQYNGTPFGMTGVNQSMFSGFNGTGGLSSGANLFSGDSRTFGQQQTQQQQQQSLI